MRHRRELNDIRAADTQTKGTSRWVHFKDKSRSVYNDIIPKSYYINAVTPVRSLVLVGDLGNERWGVALQRPC